MLHAATWYNEDVDTFKILSRVFLVLLLLVVVWLAFSALIGTLNHTLAPVQQLAQSNQALQTQVYTLLHPTPTVLPDPVTIIHEVRTLARLETIRYSVEKVITAESNQGALAALFGDRLLFVAHGLVIAGVDMEKIGAEDLWVENGVLYVRLPPAEVFLATLDNERSYVYDRETGLFTHGDPNLETTARQVAEQEIYKAALEDGILELARVNAENYLTRLFRGLGYPEVIFVSATP